MDEPLPAAPNARLQDLLRHADVRQLRDRLDELAGEEAALRTLIRSLRARDRARKSGGCRHPVPVGASD